MSYFVEIRTTVKRRSTIEIVPLEEVDQYTGFRSVYAFDAETVETIKEARSTRNLGNAQVYSDTLFVDFDGTDPASFRAALVALGVGFSVFDSGNRSIHFHVPIVPMLGAWIPQAQKDWVKKNAGGLADISFYHAAGMYRLPRTHHVKTGRAKVLTEQVAGGLLEIPKQVNKVIPLPGMSERERSEEGLTHILLRRAGIGGRTAHLFKLVSYAHGLGRSYDEALEMAQLWNAVFTAVPLAAQAVEDQCYRIYLKNSDVV
jgi:hypothetical protein